MKSTGSKPEVWLRGPLPNIPTLLQPVAHALLQAREEVVDLMLNFPDELLWVKPAGVASVGFHLQHLRGVLDRLFTYARGEQLSERQLEALQAEGKPTALGAAQLLKIFEEQLDRALEQLQQTDSTTLQDARGVGRRQISSTVIGLLVHAAEHTQRHVGQLLVTVRVLQQ